MPDPTQSPDLEVSTLSELLVAVVADVLDRLGYRSQVMSHAIRPVHPSDDVVVGRACTLQAVESRALLDNPYERELAAVDAVHPGAVVVVSTGRAYDAALWGELLTTRAIHRGAIGAVVDGGVRDTAALRRLGFATYAASVSANDSFGRIEIRSWDEPIVCGGVAVDPGDIVMADPDGVVVVPAQVASQTIDAAMEKREKEASARQDLSAGASATDVYARHGVL